MKGIIRIAIVVVILLIVVSIMIKSFKNENINEELGVFMNGDKDDNKIKFFNKDKMNEYDAYKKKNPNISDELIVVYVNIGLNREFYTEIVPSKSPNSLFVLANKFYYLDSSYVPSDLEVVNKSYASGTQQLRSEARLAFERMAIKAKEEGCNIFAVSTYRSYNYQATLYNKYVARDGTENADRYSARAGHSEHQTGLAIDIADSSMSFDNFGNTKEFIWMKDNAHKYGFILRYTTDTEWITGYLNEPWHYRYIGEDVATYIHSNPMTYEEYYVRFLDK